MKTLFASFLLFFVSDAICATYTVFNASDGATIWMSGANGDYYLPPGGSLRISPPADSAFDFTARYQVGGGAWSETYLGSLVNPQSDLVIVTHTSIDDTLGRPLSDSSLALAVGLGLSACVFGYQFAVWMLGKGIGRGALLED